MDLLVPRTLPNFATLPKLLKLHTLPRTVRIAAPFKLIARPMSMKHPSVDRAREIDGHPPYLRLRQRVEESVPDHAVRNVVHWFRNEDLRIKDNTALRTASELAHENGTKLLALFVVCPEEIKFHGVGPARLDFMQRGLAQLKEDLEKNYNVPLVSFVAESAKKRPAQIVEFAKENDISHIYANYDYEFDEVQRDLALLSALAGEDEIGLSLFHDQTVVEPGTVLSRTGTPLKVFTPFHETWVQIVGSKPDLYKVGPDPHGNDDRKGIEKLFNDDEIKLTEKGRDLSKLWPAGHDAAVKRLNEFVASKIMRYGDERSLPADDNNSRLSAYFATGMLSAREAVSVVKKANNNKKFNTGGSGPNAWIRELAFREHYRQMVAVVCPHMIMNLPQNLNLANVEYDEDEEGWKRWCEGTTGAPFVDAGMRQLKAEGFMHNRLRMNVASYLRMQLLMDFRRGEAFFAQELVDWDPCNNGWGWQPNYTSFNPVIQAEKCDPDGEYIRRWVPELKSVSGKAIFDPFNRLSEDEFAKLDYPEPYVKDFTGTKQEAVERLKAATAEAKNEEPPKKKVKSEA